MTEQDQHGDAHAHLEDPATGSSVRWMDFNDRGFPTASSTLSKTAQWGEIEAPSKTAQWGDIEGRDFPMAEKN